MQDPQVLLGRPRRLPLGPEVVGQAEAAAGEQLRPVAVVGERPRLADQPVDDVPVVDAVLAAPAQPRQLLDPLLAVPDLDPLGSEPGLHPLADQPAGHRVDVALHPDRAACLHAHAQPLARLQAAARQRPQDGHLFRQARLPPGVEPGPQLPQKGPVAVAVGEVAAATQHQGLIQGPLELAVALLDIAVLVGLARLDRLPLQAVMPQQGLVTTLEDPGVGAWLHGRREPVGAVPVRHPAQFPQGILEALTEALQALGKAHRPGLPVGVRQHEVVDQVRKGRAGDGNAQVGAVREVTGRQPAGRVHLGEEDLLGRPLLGPPLLDTPLQGPHLAVGEAAGVLPLQGLEEGLGLQARLHGQLLLDPGPGLREGVGPGSPGVVHAYLAGQALEPPVLARGLRVHAGFGRRLPRALTPEVQVAETSDLLVGDHPEPPCRGRFWIGYSPRPSGNSNCR